MYYFLGYVLIRIRLREECDCYHSYRATASPLVDQMVVDQSIPVPPPDQWLLLGYIRIPSLLYNPILKKSPKISLRIALKDACNFFRFYWCCCSG